MSIRHFALALGTLLVCLVLVGPVVALLVVLMGLAGLLALAVAGWALVLLAERWMDEGLQDFGYLDALADSLRDITLSMRLQLASRA